MGDVEIDESTLLKDDVLSIDLDDLEKDVDTWQVGHGWNPLGVATDFAETVGAAGDDEGEDVDSDLYLISIGANGPREMVKFNPKDRHARVDSASGALSYLGDDRSGRGSRKGDDEKGLIVTDLVLSTGATRVAVLANLHTPGLTYDQIGGAYVRIYPKGREHDKMAASVIQLTTEARGVRCVIFGFLEYVDDPKKPGQKKWIFRREPQSAPDIKTALELLGVKIRRPAS
ncbi:hypothetical protein JNJ66_05420 [Candidatus Saccharibacteria bacterium]|nr:hypothetical protein [Candidatus Saccharibacteria bacterium]